MDQPPDRGGLAARAGREIAGQRHEQHEAVEYEMPGRGCRMIPAPEPLGIGLRTRFDARGPLGIGALQ